MNGVHRLVVSRRIFFKIFISFWLSCMSLPKIFNKRLYAQKERPVISEAAVDNQRKMNLGAADDGFSYVYWSSGGTPKRNMKNIIDLMGGIENFIGKNDIVILKPNTQWWNQGMTNTDAMEAFIETVLEMPEFKGEIVIADNHQYKNENDRAWTTEFRNGSYNYFELIEHFNRKGFKNVSKYQWRCAGPNPTPLEGDACCGRRVMGPQDGDGYVWRDDIVYTAPDGKQCWMSYPIFTSFNSGITIDLKNGAWSDGTYLKEKQVKLINFSALNHHSRYCGVTASVKNLMGIVDMTCGFQSPEPKDTYNVHFIGVNKTIIQNINRIPWRLRSLRNLALKIAYRNFAYAGGALGTFMKTVRMPDLNIITAEWVGWGSRTRSTKSSYPKTIIASRDPVALDYIAAKEILLKSTPQEEKVYLKMNDPDNGPCGKFLKFCNEEGIGNLDAKKIKVIKGI